MRYGGMEQRFQNEGRYGEQRYSQNNEMRFNDQRYNMNNNEQRFKLHVANIPLTIDDEQFRNEFAKYGTIIEDGIIKKNQEGKPLRETFYGFIIYRTLAEANNAIAAHERSPYNWKVSLWKEVSQLL